MLSDAVVIAIAASLPSTIAAITAALISWGNRKKSKADIEAVHLLVNSRMSELLEATSGRSRSEGQAEGTEQERTRQDAMSRPTGQG